MKLRAFKVVKWVSLSAICGLAYFLFVRFTGLVIPCVFHLLTGYLCPGCGVTTVCLSLLQGDIALAISANVMVVISLPILIGSGIFHTYNYIKNGTISFGRFENGIYFLLAVAFLIFGVVRNLG